MSLESKAKSYGEIHKEIQNMFEGYEERYNLKEWVPLVDAQKEIDTLVAKVLEGIKLIDEWKQLNDDYHAELTKAEAKIEGAKPLLEKWCKECGEAEFENTCENDCTVHDLKALLFPRNELPKHKAMTIGTVNCPDGKTWKPLPQKEEPKPDLDNCFKLSEEAKTP
jgi:hypothetical protein